MSDEGRRVFEYFVVAGVPDEPEELTSGAQECGYKETTPQPPITDVCVIFPSLGEMVPDGFTRIETTPNGFSADLNHGSLRSTQCYLCYKRGFHKPPLVDLGVLYEGRGERLNLDSQMLKTTPYGRLANINNASQGIYFTYRRAPDNAPSSLLAVTDICIILTNKNEAPPHTFYKINRNLNKGMVGSDVFVCYKKSLASSSRIAYKPALLDRFPDVDYEEYPLPPSVPLFGLPMGAAIECWPAKCQTPARQFSTFVLTDQKGRKLYGAAVTFYENYVKSLSTEQLEKLGLQPDAQLRSGSCSDSTSTNDPAEQMTFHTNKCICLVSRYPFFNSFKRFLFWLHRMAVMGRYSLPIERYISHLMYEVPFPTTRRPRIMVQIGNERILFDNPEDSPLPINGASYVDTLRLLGAENYMYLMMLTLLEQKILVHSLRPWYLTSVSEALTTLIFPFHWQCPYIPQCPLDLAGVLHAPLPFVVGVDSRYFELYEDPPRDVTSVDLDTNTISQSEVKQKIKLTLLPRRAAKILRQNLDALEVRVMQEEFKVREMRSTCMQGFLPVELDLRIHHTRRGLELQIQEVFMRFMISIMKGYQHFLKPLRMQPQVGATDLEALFDVNSFLRSRDRSGHDFYKHLLNTQLFIRFIEERSFLSDKDRNAYLAFFDECMEKADSMPAPQIINPMTTPSPHFSPMGVSSLAASPADFPPMRVPQDQQQHQQDHSHFLLEFDENPSQFENAVLFAPPEVGQSPTHKKTFCYANNGFPKLTVENFALDRLITEDKGRGPQQVFPTSALDTNLAMQRTRQEAKAALKLARQQSAHPLDWAKCLLGYAYSLWFMHLPSFLLSCRDRQKDAFSTASLNKFTLKRLKMAYGVLDRMLDAKIPLGDEVCFRVLIQVCGHYGHPLMAVKVFLDMKRLGVQPNAITYGFYNRAVLEAQWPSSSTLNAQRCWALLRNALKAVARFRRASIRRAGGRRQQDGRSASVYSVDDGAPEIPSSTTKTSSPKVDVPVGDDRKHSSTLGAKLDIEAKSQTTFDLGYCSQSTWDDGASEDAVGSVRPAHFLPPTNENRLRHGEGAEFMIKRSQSIPIRMGGVIKSSRYLNNQSDYMSEALDHSKQRYRRLLSTTSSASKRKESLKLAPYLSSYDSVAGLLMTADPSLSSAAWQRLDGDNWRRKDDGTLPLDDSVFDRSGSMVTTPNKPETRQSYVGNPNDVIDAALKLQNFVAKTDLEKHTVKYADFPAVSQNLCEMQKDRAPCVDQLVDGQLATVSPFDSTKTTPTHSVRVVVTQDDPLNSAFLTTAAMPDGSVHCPTTAAMQQLATPTRKFTNENASNETPKRLLLDKRPFEDDFDWSSGKTAGQSSASATPTSASSFAIGLGRLGRGFFNRLTTTPTASPWARPSGVAAEGSAPASTYKGAGDFTPRDVDASTGVGSSGGANLSRLFKSGVASMVSDLRSWRGASAGPLLRGSLSSLALAAESSAAAFASATSLGITVDEALSMDCASVASSSEMGPADRFYYGRSAAMDADDVISQEGVGRHELKYDEDALYTDPAFQLSDEQLLPQFRLDQNCTFNNPPVFVDRKTTAAPIFSLSHCDRAKSIAVADRPGFATATPSFDICTPSFDDVPSCLEACVLIDVTLCSSTKCPHCLAYGFDDEIMAGWTADESELTTRCQFCDGKFVPQLTVEIRRTTLNKFCIDSWYVSTVDRVENPPNFSNNQLSSAPSRVDSCSTQNIYPGPDSLDHLSGKDTGSVIISGTRDRSSSLGDLTPASTFRSGRSDKSAVIKQLLTNQHRRALFSDDNAVGRKKSDSALDTSKGQVSSADLATSQSKRMDANVASSSHALAPPTFTRNHVTVPYLCPIVLRKELETVMSVEGDGCLAQDSFIDQHPIIFWNLLYFFQRIDSPTHLTNFLPSFFAREAIFENDPKFEIRCPIFVRCVYDLPHLHKTDPAKPLLSPDDVRDHSQLRFSDSSNSLMMRALLSENRSPNRTTISTVASQIVDYVRVPNLHKPVMLMINEHRKRAPPTRPSPSSLPRHFSIYRDIQLLSLSVFGKTLLMDEFEQEFDSAFAKLPPKIASMLPMKDRAPNLSVRACRKVFVPLDAN